MMTRSRRRTTQDELIASVTEAVSQVLEAEGITQTELGRRMGRTRGFVSQLLTGGRNLTLRTIADLADALGRRVRLELVPRRR